MPDLPDDLRALLSERAEHAPPAPAPTEAYVRRVTRRRAARVTVAASSGALAVTALVLAGVAAAGNAREDVIEPATPPLAPTSTAATTPAVTVTGRDVPCTDLVATADSIQSTRTWDTRQDRPPMRAREHGFTVAVREGWLAFEEDTYEAAAGATCEVVADTGPVQHDLRLREAAGGRTVWAVETVQDGSVFIHHPDKPLAEGRYRLFCAIHTSMRADVLVGQPSA